MSDVVVGVGSILSVTLGAVISSGVITYLLGAKRAERELLRAKLEKLYIDISKDIRRVHVQANHCCDYVMDIESGKDADEAMAEYDQKNPDDETPPWDAYTSIINIYFPRAATPYSNFLKKSQEINGLRFEVAIHIIISPVKEGSYKRISSKLPELVQCAKGVHAALLYEADRLNRPLWKLFLRRRKEVSF